MFDFNGRKNISRKGLMWHVVHGQSVTRLTREKSCTSCAGFTLDICFFSIYILSVKGSLGKWSEFFVQFYGNMAHSFFICEVILFVIEVIEKYKVKCFVEK